MPMRDARRPASLPTLLAACAAAVVLAPATRALAQSCAMCASSFGQNDPMSRAFSWSILFLMATPYTIVGAIGAFLFFMHRRTPGRRRATIIDLARASRFLRRSSPAEGSGGDVA
jgi:hypothetical protein